MSMILDYLTKNYSSHINVHLTLILFYQFLIATRQPFIKVINEILIEFFILILFYDFFPCCINFYGLIISK